MRPVALSRWLGVAVAKSCRQRARGPLTRILTLCAAALGACRLRWRELLVRQCANATAGGPRCGMLVRDWLGWCCVPARGGAMARPRGEGEGGTGRPVLGQRVVVAHAKCHGWPRCANLLAMSFT